MAKTLKFDLKKIFLSGTAIYASDDFIDVVRAERTAGGINITFLQRYPLVKNIRKTPYEDVPQEVDKIIEKAFLDETTKPYRVATNISNDSFMLRQFTLRGMAHGEVKNTISFEAQRYIPYPMDDLLHGFRICSRKNDAQEVIFAAVEKKELYPIIEYFEAKNILPSVIEATPLLVAQALNMSGELKKDGAYLSVHYEPMNKVVVTGICYRQPYFFREIKIFPGDDEYKTTELTYMPLKEVWSVIERDVLGSIEYLRKETKKDIDKIFISGFLPSPDEEIISKEFGTPFARINLRIFKGTQIENDDRYLPALALIRDSLGNPFLNLAPAETFRKDFWALRPVAIVSALALFLIIGIHILLMPLVSYEKNRLEEMRKKIEVYKGFDPNSPLANMLKYRELMYGKAVFVNNTVIRMIPLAEKLQHIGNDLVKDSWLESMLYRNTISEKANLFLRLEGYILAGGEAGVSGANNVVQNLKKDAQLMSGFSDVKLTSVEKSKFLKKDVTKFEILLK